MGKDIQHRLGGLFILAVGLGLGWWQIWQPYQAALAQEPLVRYSTKIFILVPICLVFGLFFLLAGDRVQYRDEERQRLTTVGWLLFAVALILGAGGWWWLSEMFDALGYQNG